MIFLEVHNHQWVVTGALHHGCLVYACNICGDRAIRDSDYRDNPAPREIIPSIDSQMSVDG